MGRVGLRPREPQGAAGRTLEPPPRLPALVFTAAGHGHGRDPVPPRANRLAEAATWDGGPARSGAGTAGPAARMSGFRLPSGGHVDRSRPITFTFDGAALSGFEGDTLASAL